MNMQTPLPLSTGQKVYLDVLRAMSAIAVLVGHAAIFFLNKNFLQTIDIQAIAVLIFFLLSGFLITYTVMRKYSQPDYKFSDFFLDRLCRIYCAYLPALIFIYFMDRYTLSFPIHMPPNRPDYVIWINKVITNANFYNLVGDVFMLQNFPAFKIMDVFHVQDSWKIAVLGTGRSLWTINIEWWIYMTFGIGVLLFMRRDWKAAPFAMLAFLFAAIIPYYYLIGGQGDCMTLVWMLGMTAALIYPRLTQMIEQKPLFTRKMLGWFLLVAIVSMLARALSLKIDHDKILFEELQFSVFLAVALFAAFFLLQNIKTVPGWIEKICSAAASFSYSLYLTHFTIIAYLYIRYPGHDADPVFFLKAIVVCIVFAIPFYWLFERHYHSAAKFLKKIYARRSHGLTSSR